MPSCHLRVYHTCLTLCMLRSDKNIFKKWPLRKIHYFEYFINKKCKSLELLTINI